MSVINKININGIDYDIEDKNKATKTSQLENDSKFISQLKTVNGQSLEGEGDIEIEGGSGDTLPINAIFEYEGDTVPEGYEEVEEEPSIVVETDPTVPDYVKAITQEDIEKWNTDVDLTDYAKKSEIPTNVSQLTNDKNYINQIKTINGQSLEGEGDIEIESGSGGILEETDPTVPAHVKDITEEDIAKWNSGTASAGDTLPINSIFAYEGDIVPEGYVEVEPSSNGGSSEIISLDEQVIGKDKDGKIIYKKTILSTVDTETTIKYEDTNIYRVVDFNVIAYDGTNTIKLPHFMVEPDGTIPYVQAWFNLWKGSTRLFARCSEHYTGYNIEITIKYTKTTD